MRDCYYQSVNIYMDVETVLYNTCPNLFGCPIIAFRYLTSMVAVNGLGQIFQDIPLKNVSESSQAQYGVIEVVRFSRERERFFAHL